MSMCTTTRLATAARSAGAAKWRLAQSLKAMEERLAARGARLDVMRGEADKVILALAASANAGRVLWTRRYESASIALDAGVKTRLRERGVEALSFNGRLMREPWEVAKPDGALSGSFSAFWRRHRALAPLPSPSRAPDRLNAAPWPEDAPERVTIEALRLTPTKPDWSGELALGETPGEAGALAALDRFIDGALAGYAEGRDLTSRETTSRLSPHLRFGEVSTRRIAAAVENAAAAGPAVQRDAEKFMAELGWRDFAAALLYRHPDLATRPLRREFERFPWRDDEKGFRAWAHGRTGYPIVDAGMRQLWRTGFMHNRVRMIAASFLVKHLLIDWRAWRAMVLGHAHRRRSRQQPDGLAMGRGLGRGRCALLPHLQSGAAGAKNSTPTAPTCAAGSRSLRSSQRRKSTRPGGLRPKRWRAPAWSWARPIRIRSSTTPSPAPGRWRRSRRCALSRRGREPAAPEPSAAKRQSTRSFFTSEKTSL